MQLLHKVQRIDAYDLHDSSIEWVSSTWPRKANGSLIVESKWAINSHSCVGGCASVESLPLTRTRAVLYCVISRCCAISRTDCRDLPNKPLSQWHHDLMISCAVNWCPPIGNTSNRGRPGSDRDPFFDPQLLTESLTLWPVQTSREGHIRWRHRYCQLDQANIECGVGLMCEW